MSMEQTGDPFLEVDEIRTEPEAVTWALNAAVQQRQNTVYRSAIGREEFRDAFKALMRAESLAYKQSVSEQQHCATIRRIADTLSEQFGTILTNGRLRYGTAQKAFNLYLKYLWRFGRIGTPPHCPVDRVVLEAAGVEGSWTASDSEDEYLSWISVILKQANETGLSLAEWEHKEWLGWRLQQAQEDNSAKSAQRSRGKRKRPEQAGGPSISTASLEFERAYKTTPICWSYDSARPRFIYLSLDNLESTRASYRFDYTAVIHKLKPRQLSKNGYRYFELAG